MQQGGEGGDHMEKQLKQQQQEEYKQTILMQILAAQARDRLAKIKLVKPEKVAAIENSLIAAAQQGKLRGKISEEELIAMLGSQSSNDNKIIFKRRGIDDEW